MNKARGKSGPLFNFDVHDDVRLLADATVEKDESHAGKVVERSYYQRNKHIFPASRWEVRIPSYIQFSPLNPISHNFFFRLCVLASRCRFPPDFPNLLGLRSREELWQVHHCLMDIYLQMGSRLLEGEKNRCMEGA